MIKKIYDYDNPYRILAHHILAFYTPQDVLRFLVDDHFVLNQIVKETRQQDFGGVFTDCIIEDILEHKKRMEYMGELDKLSEYYFKRLDLPRLRDEITLALKNCGLEVVLENQATGGNVSSAST